MAAQIDESWTPTRIARGVRRRLGLVGFYVMPVYLVREDGRPVGAIEIDERFHFEELGPDDNAELLRLENRSDQDVYLRRFRAGKLCFGIKAGEQLISKVWCALDEIDSQFHRRRLEAHEAYFFDVFCDPAYRGLNLTPYLRLRCYQVLRDRGRTTYYSVTEFFNRSAKRFKAKVGAVNERLLVHVSCFGRFHRTWSVPLPGRRRR